MHVFHYVILVLSLFQYLNKNPVTMACPSDVCICKWKGGKQSVECGGQLLTKIPNGMDPGTQVLNFSGNGLQVLQNERFLKLDLINLQKIYLSRNQLIKIHDKAFRGLSNLVELDLSDNMLQHVPTETFQDYTSLMRLSLSGNPIRELKTSSFRHLPFLTTLELSNCQIEKIENEAFIGMDNLEWLRLDGNRISFIQGNYILPKSLHGISLQNNRWTCDCRLTDVHAWLINYNTPQAEEPKCVEPPRLKGHIIKSLKKDQLACLPEINPPSSYMEISEGRNISLPCMVRAIPQAKVFWLFNGQILNNDTLFEALHLYYYMDGTENEEKRSEVFIYNVGSEDNGTFSCVAENVAGVTYTNYTVRVITKEPPIANEVSFSKDYRNVIFACVGGVALILILVFFTIAAKCYRKRPKNRGTKSETTSSETGILKCPSIINEEDMSPKSSKENGIAMGSQMKQNFMMYVPTIPLGSVVDNGSMQLNNASAVSTPPPPLSNNHSTSVLATTQYCSPQSSIRNFMEKNPDLINDAESVKNKSNAEGEMNSQYDGNMPGNFENCYQLTDQYSSKIIRPPIQTRFNNLNPLPRTINVQVGGAGGGQHQVDVHLNPVCLLGSDGFAFDFSSNHLLNGNQAITNNQQQNFYRTLPYNRGHNKHCNISAANPGARYSLEAEFLQRSATPTYEKYIPNMRFTVEGYPAQPLQYPSPPDDYKGDISLPESLNNRQAACLTTTAVGFQNWPPCLPGYHAQPIRFPSSQSNIILQSCLALSENPQQQQPQDQQPSSTAVNFIQTATTSTSTCTTQPEVKRRCVSAQTNELDTPTIPECDEEQENPNSSKLRHLSGPLADSPDEGYVGDSQEGSDI